MTQKILLLTTVDWPSAALLAGALAALDAEVEAVFPPGHVLALSRHLARAHRYRALAPRASFAAAIDEARPNLVIPCDDRAVRILLALGRPDLDTLLERSLGRLSSYPALMARATAAGAAREEGLAAPESVGVETAEAFEAQLRRFGLPAVLKVDGSWGGDGVAVLRTRQQAERAWRKLARPPSRLRSLARAVLRADTHFLADAWMPKTPHVVLQRFIAGRPATSAFVCRDGEVLAALHMDVVAWQGATGPAAILRPVDCPRMAEACRAIAKRFGLSGFIGLDFMRDEAGTAHLIEVNPRATQICHLALGADLAAAFLGKTPRAPMTDKPLIALFPQAASLDSEGVLATAFWDLPGDDPRVLARVLGRNWNLADGIAFHFGQGLAPTRLKS
jgi:predicted ATP-grasp superfamily ATP-dependent carboligase